MKACFTKNTKTKNKKNKFKGPKKRNIYYLRQVLNPGPSTKKLDALPIVPRKPAANEMVNLSSLNLLPMKFCWSTPFEASKALFIKN